MNRKIFTAVALGITLVAGGCGSDNDDDSSGNNNPNVTPPTPPTPSPVGFYAGNLKNADFINSVLPNPGSRVKGPDKYYMLVLPTDVKDEAQVWGGYVDTDGGVGESWWGVIKGKANAAYNGTKLDVGAFESLVLSECDRSPYVCKDEVLQGSDLIMTYDEAIPQITSGTAELTLLLTPPLPAQLPLELDVAAEQPDFNFYQKADITQLENNGTPWLMRDHYLAAKRQALGGPSKSSEGDLEVKVSGTDLEAKYNLQGPSGGQCKVTGTVTPSAEYNYFTFTATSEATCAPDDGETINGVIVIDDNGKIIVFGESDGIDASGMPERAGIIMTTR